MWHGLCNIIPVMKDIKILLIDNEAIILTGRKYSIESACNYVKIALCGKNASDVLSEGIPAMVLTDLTVPRMSGVDICRKIKARYLDIETVLVSGSHEEIRRHLLDTLQAEDHNSTDENLLKLSLNELGGRDDKV